MLRAARRMRSLSSACDVESVAGPIPIAGPAPPFPTQVRNCAVRSIDPSKQPYPTFPSQPAESSRRAHSAPCPGSGRWLPVPAIPLSLASVPKRDHPHGPLHSNWRKRCEVGSGPSGCPGGSRDAQGGAGIPSCFEARTYARTHACLHARTHTLTHARARHVHKHAHTRIRTRARARTHGHTRIHTHAHARKHTDTSTRMRARTQTYASARARARLQTHPRTRHSRTHARTHAPAASTTTGLIDQDDGSGSARRVPALEGGASELCDCRSFGTKPFPCECASYLLQAPRSQQSSKAAELPSSELRRGHEIPYAQRDQKLYAQILVRTRICTCQNLYVPESVRADSGTLSARRDPPRAA